MHLRNKLRGVGQERGKRTSNVSKETSSRTAAPGSQTRGNRGIGEPACCGYRFSALRCPASATVRPPATVVKLQLSPSLQPSPRLWPRSSPNRPSSSLSAPAGRAPGPLPYLRLPPGPRRPPSTPVAASPRSGAESQLRSAATGVLGPPAVAAGSKATYMVDAASLFPRRLRPLSLLLSNPQFSRPPAPPSSSRPRHVWIRRPGKKSRVQIESSSTAWLVRPPPPSQRKAGRLHA